MVPMLRRWRSGILRVYVRPTGVLLCLPPSRHAIRGRGEAQGAVPAYVVRGARISVQHHGCAVFMVICAAKGYTTTVTHTMDEG
jgi:hypothetical protein